MKFFVIILPLCMLLLSGCVNKENNSRFTVHVYNEGYNATIKINGHSFPQLTNTSFSHSVQIYHINHPMKSNASPDQHKHFSMKSTKNTISIKYKKLPNKSNYSLHITASSYVSPKLDFEFKEKGDEGEEVFEFHITQQN